jgi:hypothetical protein
MPEQPTKETSGPELCPKNPFGHSWQRLDQRGDRLQQRCRFCRQTRERHLPPSLRVREPRTGAEKG